MAHLQTPVLPPVSDRATRAGSGLSLDLDAFRAGAAAASEAALAAGGTPDLLVVFGTSRHRLDQVLAGVRSVGPDAVVVGCSGEGVIAGSRSEERERVVSVLAVRSSGLRFASVLVEGYGADPRGAGARLATWVNQQEATDALALLVFPDGLVGDCTSMLDALGNGLLVPLPIVGGTSADAFTFEKTFQWAGDRVASEAVSALLIRGAGSVKTAVSHGCERLGSQRTVTRASGGWLHEIDGEPAWSVFKEYLDGDPTELNAEGVAHLCVGESIETEPGSDYGPLIIRTPLKLDAASGALFFPGGGLAERSTIHLTRRDQDRIRRSAKASAESLGAGLSGAPAFVFQFDCSGRGRMLFGGGVAAALVEPLRVALGADTPWVGFHGYGEVAPIGGRARYHNYAVVLCAVFDSESR